MSPAVLLLKLTPADDALLGKLARISAGIARDRGVSEAGWIAAW